MAQITVITSAYNVGAYIERYVSSLKSQTFKDFVVICRDDHSSDDTLEKLRELCKDDDRFQIIESAQNEGVYYNLKQTLDSVETPYLCFLDPDDWIDDAYLESLYDAIVQSDADMAKASLARDYDTGRVVYDHKNAKIRKDISKRRHVALHFCGSQWITNLYRTSFIRQHHISFQTRASGLEWDCDDIFILNILLNNPKIAFCDNVFYHYYQRSTSAVHQINALRFTSTIKSRQIETELLNQYYRDKKISKKDYISIISRLLIELSKHYRIYSSQEHFDKRAYLSGMQEIVEAAIYCPSYSFVERLESKDLDMAGKRLATKPLYYIDRLRAWIAGY